MSKTQPARGMRDFLPADIRKRNYVINIIREVYESYGFEPLETPAVENLETLMGKYGEEGNQLVFKILKRGEKLDVNSTDLADLALRYDLTVPLARVVANYRNELPKFFKRYQIQPVWRADRPARGRFREFYQCDVDAIGSKSMIIEAELCAAVSEILTRLGFEDFTIRLNHRGILDSSLTVLGVPKEKHTDVLITVDKLDKIGKEAVAEELRHKGISDHAIEGFIVLLDSMNRLNIDEDDLLDTDSSSGSKLESVRYDKPLFNKVFNGLAVKKIKEFFDDFEEDAVGLDDIIGILELLKDTYASGKVRIDFSLARGLSYYTGAIFEINVPDLAGSLGGGGRYDGLIGMFGKEQIPACGFSLGLERILVVMNERGMFPPELDTNPADVLVTVWNEESVAESLNLANELRKSGLRVLVYPETDKLGKQFKYADAIGINHVCVLGDSELAENKVTLKDLQTGAQETVSRDEVAEKVKG